MFQSIKQLVTLLLRSKKFWLIPTLLLLVVIALFVISAQIAPVPIFLYPII